MSPCENISFSLLVRTMIAVPNAVTTAQFFTSVTLTGVTIVVVVMLAVPLMPGFNSRTDICGPSILKRMSSATVSSRVRHLHIRWSPSIAGKPRDDAEPDK